MTIIKEKDIDIKTAVENFKEKVSDSNFGIISEFDYQKILQEKGFDVELDTISFNVCNPLAAKTALIDYPELSFFLPCKVTFRKQNNKTLIETMDMPKVMKNLNLQMPEKVESDFDLLFVEFMELIVL